MKSRSSLFAAASGAYNIDAGLAHHDFVTPFRTGRGRAKHNPVALAGRIEAGLEKCRQRLATRPKWVQKQPTPQQPNRMNTVPPAPNPEAKPFDETKFPF